MTGFLTGEPSYLADVLCAFLVLGCLYSIVLIAIDVVQTRRRRDSAYRREHDEQIINELR